MTLQQFRAITLPPSLQRLGEWVGGGGMIYWFWWVLVEKGALRSLTESPALQEILLGLPLILILPAIYYTAIFLLLRFGVWLLLPIEKKPMDQEDPPVFLDD